MNWTDGLDLTGWKIRNHYAERQSVEAVLSIYDDGDLGVRYERKNYVYLDFGTPARALSVANVIIAALTEAEKEKAFPTRTELRDDIVGRETGIGEWGFFGGDSPSKAAIDACYDLVVCFANAGKPQTSADLHKSYKGLIGDLS